MIKNYAMLNVSELEKETMKLTGAEIRFLLALIYYVNKRENNIIISNKELREYIATQGVEVTPIRVSSLFSSLTKKGVLKKEASGVYIIMENLFLQEGNL